MWALFLGSVAWAGGLEIAVSGPGEVHVRAQSEPVHIAACRGVQWELFDPKTKVFEPAMTQTCEGLKTAFLIDQNGRSFQLDAILPPLPDVGFHVVRSVVVFGSKCNDNVPFPMAECERLDAAHGPQMVVRNRGAAVPKVASKKQ